MVSFCFNSITTRQKLEELHLLGHLQYWFNEDENILICNQNRKDLVNGIKPKEEEKPNSTNFGLIKSTILIYEGKIDQVELDKYCYKFSVENVKDLIETKNLEIRLFVTNPNSSNENPFTNPFYHALKSKFYRYNNTFPFCVIEDPFLFNINDGKIDFENNTLDKIIDSLKKTGIKLDSVFIPISVSNSNTFPIEKKTVAELSLYFLPIKKFTNKKTGNDGNRFHDRNIVTEDYWINNGNSIDLFKDKRTHTQTFIVPRISYKKQHQSKVVGLLTIFERYCEELRCYLNNNGNTLYNFKDLKEILELIIIERNTI